MLKLLSKIDNFITLVLKIAIGVLMVFVMTVLFAAVIFRYFLNSPIFWADEVSTYSLVFITFLGAYLVLRYGKMIRITLILDALPKPVSRIITIMTNIATMGFMVLVGNQGVLILGQRVIQIQNTVALRIPMITFYRMIPVMVVLMLFGLIIDTLGLIFPGHFEVKKSFQGGETA